MPSSFISHIAFRFVNRSLVRKRRDISFSHGSFRDGTPIGTCRAYIKPQEFRRQSDTLTVGEGIYRLHDRLWILIPFPSKSSKILIYYSYQQVCRQAVIWAIYAINGQVKRQVNQLKYRKIFIAFEIILFSYDLRIILFL